MRKLPTTPKQWFDEIRLAIADANDTKPFGILTGHPITDADLFHVAPLVALKFRGRKTKGLEAKRVTEMALANYVVNSDPDARAAPGQDQGQCKTGQVSSIGELLASQHPTAEAPKVDPI